MKLLSSSVVALLTAIAVISPLSAADKKVKLSEWKFGKVAFGEKITNKLTKDKVVVVEFWGVNCPPCIASLPHLAEMAKEKHDQGLVVIGAESQMSTPAQMKPLLDTAKVQYTITQGAEGPIQVSQLPRVFVFGKDGLLAFDGSPLSEEFPKAVDEALGTKAVADKH